MQQPTRSSYAITATGATLITISGFLAGPEKPDEGASAARLREFYESNLDSLGLPVLGAMLGLTGMILLVVGLRRLIVDSIGDSALADLVGVCGVLSGLYYLVLAGVSSVPLVAADDDGKLGWLDDSTVLAFDLFDRLGETIGDAVTVPRGGLLVAVGLAVVRGGFLPRWVGHLALVIGAFSIVALPAVAWNVAAFSIAFFVGLFGFALWCLLLAVAAVVRSRKAAPSASAVAPAGLATGR